MPTTHRVQQGECLTSIAETYGFYWQTLWKHPDNKRLQELGRTPNVLQPGDEVVIPDKRIAEYVRPTGARHSWKVKGIPAKLRMRLMWNDEPRANEKYTLTVDGTLIEGSTDGDGGIEVTIPPRALQGTLRVGEGDRAEEFSLSLGHLDPVSDLSGVQARLANLGYACRITGSLDDETRAALRAYQAATRLPVTGEADDVTRSRLRATHDAL